MWNGSLVECHSMGWVALMQVYFIAYRNIFISNITLIVINQKYFKPLFHLIKSSTKLIEFDNVKFSVSISSENSVSREFLEIDSNSTFSNRWAPQKRKFSYPFLQSKSYNNVILRWYCYIQRLPGFRKT